MASKRLPTFISYAVLVATGLIVLHLIFGAALWNPNEYALADGRDAWKNYFTPLWYLLHDSGWQFSGMNYPYGEHIVFTDNQPLIAAVLNLAQSLGIPIADYTVGIYNTLMFASVVVCMLLLYTLARHYRLPHTHSIIIAILITLCAPQINRLNGHYSLAYLAFFPLVWYLSVRILDHAFERKRLIGLGVVIFLSGWVHPYYLFIGAMFIVLMAGIQVFIDRSWDYKQAIWMIVITALLPAATFFALLSGTDSVTDRPESPLGFLYYRADPRGIFLPPYSPLNALWPYPRGDHGVQYEGFAYIGLIATLLCGVGAWRLMGRWLRKKPRRWPLSTRPRSLQSALWAASIILLFSMGFPFGLGLQGLLEYLGPLQQFRSIGRFAWVFYYVITLYAAYALYHWYRFWRCNGPVLAANGLLASALALWSYEAFLHVQNSAPTPTRNDLNENLSAYTERLKTTGFAPTDFQAIIPLPLFNAGSEKFDTPGATDQILTESLRLALGLSLPITSANLSRASLTQARRQMQLLADDRIAKEILADLPDERPLLVLLQKGAPLNHYEQAFADKGTVLAVDDGFIWLHLDLALLTPDFEALILEFEQLRERELTHYGDMFISDPGWLYFDAFDQTIGSPFGTDTLKSAPGEKTITLFEGYLPEIPLLASGWVRIRADEPGMPKLILRETDAQGRDIDHRRYALYAEHNIYRDWLRFEFPVFVPAKGHRFGLQLQGRHPEAESLLIRPADIHVYQPNAAGHRLMVDNYYLP